MICPKGIQSDLMSSGNKIEHFNLMTEVDYGSTTPVGSQRRTKNRQTPLPQFDKIFDKIYAMKGNPRWYELNGGMNPKRFDESGIECITKLAGGAALAEVSEQSVEHGQLRASNPES